MQLVAYRSTERGIIDRLGNQLKVANAARLEAQRLAWVARIEADALRNEHARKAAEKNRVFARAIRSHGDGRTRSVREIELIACRVFKVTSTALRSDRRDRRLVMARQFVMYWACRLTPLSLPTIGKLLGNRDHTTILHGKDAYVKKRASMGRFLKSAR